MFCNCEKQMSVLNLEIEKLKSRIYHLEEFDTKIRRTDSAWIKADVYSVVSVIELILEYLNIKLVKIPATYESAKLEPKEPK